MKSNLSVTTSGNLHQLLHAVKYLFATQILHLTANKAYVRVPELWEFLNCEISSLATIFLSHDYQMANSWIACLGICSFPRSLRPYPVLFTSTQKSYSLYTSQLLGAAGEPSGPNYICRQLL